MKKKFLLFLGFLLCSVSAFAQYTYKDLNDMPGCCVAYVDADGNHLNIVNVQSAYIASYFNENEIYVATFTIEKNFQSTVTLLEALQGSVEECENTIIAQVKEIISMGDYGNRDKLPGGVYVEKKDLSGKLIKSAVLDFYVPITNIVSISDSEGNMLNRCIYIGAISPDVVNDFLVSVIDTSDGVMRDMKTVKEKSGSKTTIGKLEMKLPKNFEYSSEDDAYVLADTTKRDSAIQVFSEDLEEEEMADLHAYFMLQLLSKEGLIIPESINISEIGKAKILRIDYLSPNYWEFNTVMICMFPTDDTGLHYEVMSINGYTSFIEQNMKMYTNLIKSVKVKK